MARPIFEAGEHANGVFVLPTLDEFGFDVHFEPQQLIFQLHDISEKRFALG
jgi:hypothetical protein